MAGYLPYMSSRGTNEKDFNNIFSEGKYLFAIAVDGYSNIPNVMSLEGILIVVQSSSSLNCVQIYIGLQDKSFHIRTRYNGAWNSWEKIV